MIKEALGDLPPSKTMERQTRIAALLLAVPGLVAPFLSFTHGVSPLQAVQSLGELSLLGSPFFLAIPIALWQARRLFASRLTTIDIATAGLLSAGAMISVLSFIAFIVLRDGLDIFSEIDFAASALACSLLVVANVALLWRNRARRLPSDATAEAFLLGGYVPAVVFCLLAFGWLDPSLLQAGAWTAAIACIAYIVSIALTLRYAGPPSPPAAADHLLILTKRDSHEGV